MVFMPHYVRNETVVERSNSYDTTENLIQENPSNTTIGKCSTAQSQSQPTSSYINNDAAGEDLEDLSEVTILNFYCKQCIYSCENKRNLQGHLKEIHGLNSLTDTDNETLQEPSTTRVEKNHGNLVEAADLSLELEVEEIVQEQESNLPIQAQVQVHQPQNQPQDRIEIETEQNDNNSSQENSVQNENEGNNGLFENIFLCAECNIMFSSQDEIVKHMSEVHQLRQFNSEFIRDEIIGKSDDNSKQDGENNKNTNEQNTNTNTTNNNNCNKIKVKRKGKKSTKYPCSNGKCKSAFKSEENYESHVKCHSKEGKGYQCYICSKNFTFWGLCSIHLWNQHQIDIELFTCKVCTFKTFKYSKLKDHEKSNCPEETFKCSTCHKIFKQSRKLRAHEKYHEEFGKLPPPWENGNSKWYTPKECPICKRILSDSKCLKKHISAVHNKLKPYFCNICNHTSARKAELQLHMRQHTGEKPYKCNECNFATGDHNSLRNHKLRHTEKRPYSCPHCPYACIQSGAFKKHIVTAHPNQVEGVFFCQSCSFVTVNKTQNDYHSKDHEEGRIPQISPSPSSPNSNNGIHQRNSYNNETNDDSSDTGSRSSVIDTGGFTIVENSSTTSQPDRDQEVTISVIEDISNSNNDNDKEMSIIEDHRIEIELPTLSLLN